MQRVVSLFYFTYSFYVWFGIGKLNSKTLRFFSPFLYFVVILMALRSTKPLTEMSASNLLGGKGRPARKANNLTAICKPIIKKLWEPRRLTTLWASTARYKDSFTLP
jgi:hypothetical protein